MARSADRQRRFRQRQRHGIAVWPVEVPEIELRDALVDAGLVDAAGTEAEYRAAAARVLAGFVGELSATRYGRYLARRRKNDA